jgi:TrwC relaxase
VLSSAKIGRSSWRYYSRTVAGGACEYYAEHGDAPGRWHGSGLAQLGLTAGAEVKERELEALFGRALSPTTGAALGSAWRADAVTGFDLTFSAPKSVSTLWALGDARTMAAIDAAHGAAVSAALGYLESHASLSRRGRDGVEQIGSAGFTAALFDHRTSRTGDPQLHTHALVVNKVRCDDCGCNPRLMVANAVVVRVRSSLRSENSRRRFDVLRRTATSCVGRRFSSRGNSTPAIDKRRVHRRVSTGWSCGRTWKERSDGSVGSCVSRAVRSPHGAFRTSRPRF